MADNAIPLVVRDLHKSFNDVPVLEGLSLEAHEGDVISLIGASGSGKSTFLRCMNLLEIPNAGDIVVHGESVAFRPGAASASRPTGNRWNASVRSCRWSSRASISGLT